MMVFLVCFLAILSLAAFIFIMINFDSIEKDIKKIKKKCEDIDKIENRFRHYKETWYYNLIDLTDEIAKNSEKISASEYKKIRQRLIRD